MRDSATRRAMGLVGAWAVAVLATGCDSGGGAPADAGAPTGPRYRAECHVTVESTAALPTFEGTGRGAGMDAAEAATWANLCPQAGLPADCGDTLPEGIERSSWACMGLTVEGTGISAADSITHQCTIELTDGRGRQTAEGTAERVGSDSETAAPETLCTDAIAQACQQVAAAGDCTAGATPAFRVTGQSSSRELQSGAAGR